MPGGSVAGKEGRRHISTLVIDCGWFRFTRELVVWLCIVVAIWHVMAPRPGAISNHLGDVELASGHLAMWRVEGFVFVLFADTKSGRGHTETMGQSLPC
jgi:hypothetical protein